MVLDQPNDFDQVRDQYDVRQLNPNQQLQLLENLKHSQLVRRENYHLIQLGHQVIRLDYQSHLLIRESQ